MMGQKKVKERSHGPYNYEAPQLVLEFDVQF